VIGVGVDLVVVNYCVVGFGDVDFVVEVCSW